MYLTICPLRDPASILGHGGVFQGVFSMANHKRMRAESLPMMHPGKCCVKDSIGQFLTTPYRCSDTVDGEGVHRFSHQVSSGRYFLMKLIPSFELYRPR